MMPPARAEAGPASCNRMLAPAVTVVDCPATLLEPSGSFAVGIDTLTVYVPDAVVRMFTADDTRPSGASAGTVHTTVAGPVAGVGAQPVMVPVAPVKTVPAGMARLIVVAGDAVKVLLSTVT